jgi:hypothetical protein
VNIAIPLRSSLSSLALAVVATAQTPPRPAPAPRPEPQPAREQLERARVLLAQHGERSKTVRVLVADYVQRRTTALSKEPFVSKGRFLFVREPAAVVFAGTEPRVSTARLTGATYEVWRPQQNRLERFHLGGPELAQGLFAAVGGDVQRLEREFAIVACDDGKPGSGTAVIRFAPRSDAVRERLQQLVLTLDGKDGALRAVGYRDHAGDWIDIELGNVRVDPSDAPSAALDVPANATVVEHAAPARK